MIIIQPYQPGWRTEFADLRSVLGSALQEFNLDIQHIGSTAIPGLAAKPVLDVDIILTDADQLDDVSAKLEELGYAAAGTQGVPGRYAFKQYSERVPVSGNYRTWMKHHLYVCYPNSVSLRNHLLFRDALRNNDALAKQYGKLKLDLAAEKEMTIENYVRRKTAFIVEVLRKAGVNEDELAEIMEANK